MATDGPDPTPCDPDIFQNGTQVCIITGSSNALERWVRKVAAKANTQVDWHYYGGRGNVLHLGDGASRQRAIDAIKELAPQLEGHLWIVDGQSYHGGKEQN